MRLENKRSVVGLVEKPLGGRRLGFCEYGEADLRWSERTPWSTRRFIMRIWRDVTDWSLSAFPNKGEDERTRFLKLIIHIELIVTWLTSEQKIGTRAQGHVRNKLTHFFSGKNKCWGRHERRTATGDLNGKCNSGAFWDPINLKVIVW